jgi:hypothetical protein
MKLLVLLFLIISCQTIDYRCDFQRLEDQIYEVKLRTMPLSKRAIKNLIKSRKSTREMECISAKIDGKTLCCKKDSK